LQKKHPGKKYRTLQKQAASEYRAGSIPKPRKKAAPKAKKKKRSKVGGVAKLGTRYKVYHEVKKVGKRKRKRSTARKTAKRKIVTRTRTVTKYRRVGKAGMSTTTKLLIVGGLAVGAYLLLRQSKPGITVPGVSPILTQTGNTARDMSAANLLQYAQAAGAGVSALTSLINALNGMNDAAVVSNYQMVQQGGDINTLLALPTGGPSISLGG
jgi:hypothetical protein